MRPTARALVIAGLLGGSLAVAGCTEVQPATAPVPAELSQATLTVLTKGGSFADDEAVLKRASEQLIRRCMADEGYQYTPMVYEPGSMMSLADDDAHPDLVWRRAAGYSMRPEFSSQARKENERYLKTLPPARRDGWNRALTGDGSRMSSMTGPTGRTFHSPLEGCVANSGQVLYGSTAGSDLADYYLQDGRVRLLAGLDDDAGYRSATERWAACMRDRNRPFATPAKAREAVQARYERDGASGAALREEVAISLADAGCVARAGLTGQADRFVRDKAGALPAGIRRDLNRATTARLSGIAEARKILAEARARS